MHASVHAFSLSLSLPVRLSLSSTPRPHPLAHSLSLPYLCLSVLLCNLPSHGLLYVRCKVY